jgi:hypothetical protein
MKLKMEKLTKEGMLFNLSECLEAERISLGLCQEMVQNSDKYILNDREFDGKDDCDRQALRNQIAIIVHDNKKHIKILKKLIKKVKKYYQE